MVGTRYEKVRSMKAVVFTLGCKVNECESDSLITGLINRGYEVSDKLEYADLYIVNTCAVTAEAEKKSRQTASRIEKLNPKAEIIFTGCAAQKSYENFSAKKNARLITGTFSKNKILEMLDKRGVYIAGEDKEFEELLPVKSLKTRTFIKVQDGCDNFCSYCIIPYLRGRSRSRNPESVLNEIRAVSPQEAVLGGINLSAYNYNGTDLTGLLKVLKNEDCRIRLGSLEVNVITDEFLSAANEMKNFAPHFHLSLQSGSNSVLKKMNRHYTAEEFIEKAELIRKYFPLAGITTDVIAGFPTETKEDFSDTLNLIDKVRFSDIHAFCYSMRSGTAAAKLKELPPEAKKERLNRLLLKKEEMKSAFVREMTGKTLSFVFEESVDGYGEGYSENYLRLYVKGLKDCTRPVKVKVVNAFKDGAEATPVD